MRIAVLTSYFPEPSITFILDQIAGLIDRGHDVEIFADRPGDTRVVHPIVQQYGMIERTTYFHLPPGLFRRLQRAPIVALRQLAHHPRQLFRSLNTSRYSVAALSLRILFAAARMRTPVSFDICHAHFGPNGLLNLALHEMGLMTGRMITTFHGYDINAAPRRHGFRMYRQLFANCAAFTANTRYTARRAMQLGCPPDRIFLLPVGLDTGQYAYSERRLQKSGVLNLLTVGRLVEKKGLEYSIRAFSQVIRRHPNTHYRIIGTGPLRAHLESLVQELRLTQHVSFLGALSRQDVVINYAKAHIFILSSATAANGDQEGQGLVLQEAQMMGLPVISTLHNGIPEGVLDGKSAILVPERDVPALAQAISHLIEHPERWIAMGREGRAFVERRYNINGLNDRLVGIYNTVLSRE